MVSKINKANFTLLYHYAHDTCKEPEEIWKVLPFFFFPFYRRQALFYDEINDTWQQSSAEALLSSCCREVKNSRLGEKKVSG